jgi:hypothetical protein
MARARRHRLLAPIHVWVCGEHNVSLIATRRAIGRSHTRPTRLASDVVLKVVGPSSCDCSVVRIMETTFGEERRGIRGDIWIFSSLYKCILPSFVCLNAPSRHAIPSVKPVAQCAITDSALAPISSFPAHHSSARQPSATNSTDLAIGLVFSRAPVPAGRSQSSVAA